MELSTPFWEFPSILPIIPYMIPAYYCLSTPFWEFREEELRKKAEELKKPFYSLLGVSDDEQGHCLLWCV